MNHGDTFLDNLAAQAAQRWDSAMAQILGADLHERREWTGHAIGPVLSQLVVGMRGVQLVTPLHYVPTPMERRPETTGVEAWASYGIANDITADGQPVLRLTAPRDRTSWLAPSTLSYFPSAGAASQDGVFVLRVAHPTPLALRLDRHATDLLREPTAPASFPQWVAGGVIFAAEGGRVRRAAAQAPPETWNDFDGLVTWALELIGTPPAGTGEPSADDPAVLATLRGALARHRERSQRTIANRLDQSDVDAVAAAAVTIGIQPTVRLITAVAKGGSPNVINPMMQSFWARASREGLLGGGPAPTPTPVPEALLALYQELRTSARDAGEASLIPTREALKAREGELADRDAELTQRAEALDAAEAVATAAREQMAAQIQDLQSQREQDRESLATAQRMAQADATALAAVRAELAASREAASKLADEVARLGALVEHGKARDATLTAERDAARQDASSLQMKVTTLGIEHKSLERTEREQRAANEMLRERWDGERTAHEATRERLTREMQEIIARATLIDREKNQLAVRAAELEGQLTAVDRERVRTEGEVQRLRDDLARLNVEIGLVSAERDRDREKAAAARDGGAPAADS